MYSFEEKLNSPSTINNQEQNKATEYEHWEELLSEFRLISFLILKQDRKKKQFSVNIVYNNQIIE